MNLDIDSAGLSVKKNNYINQNMIDMYNLNNIKNFENKNVSENISKIKFSRYEELLPYVYYIKDYINIKYFEEFPLMPLLYRYDRINKFLKPIEENRKLITNIGSINVDETDINLLTALSTDSEFNYLKSHFYCLNNNLDEQEYFINNYSFYSKKLLVIEESIYLLFKKYEQELALTNAENER